VTSLHLVRASLRRLLQANDMFGNQSPPQQKPFGIGDQMSCSQQQTLPVAMFAGTRKVAVKAMSKVYNLYTAPAPNQTPQKK